MKAHNATTAVPTVPETHAVITGMIAAMIVPLMLLGCSKKPPEGQAGPAADALATLIEERVRVDLWKETKAVKWTFGGKNEHLWDRARQYHRVRFKDYEVLIDLTSKKGVAFEDGEPVVGEDADELVEKAYKYWINDSFWLNPLAKFRDKSVTRSIVESRPEADDEKREKLLISYSGGGLTPGDSYLWIVDTSGLPKAWKMWVSIIPVGGAEASWEGWITLSTGAIVSTKHTFLGITLSLDDVEGATSLEALESGDDPFKPLVDFLKK